MDMERPDLAERLTSKEWARELGKQSRKRRMREAAGTAQRVGVAAEEAQELRDTDNVTRELTRSSVKRQRRTADEPARAGRDEHGTEDIEMLHGGRLVP